MVAERLCACCGLPLGPDNLAWNYEWPDDLARLSGRKRRKVVRAATGMVVVATGYGNAVRAILPIPLDDGREVTLGVWLGLDPADFERVCEAGATGGDAWTGLRFAGVLLNAVAPWDGVLLKPATATASEPGKVARITESADPALAAVLTGPSPHAEVLRHRGSGMSASVG
jgi:hypothetical protein